MHLKVSKMEAGEKPVVNNLAKPAKQKRGKKVRRTMLVISTPRLEQTLISYCKLKLSRTRTWPCVTSFLGLNIYFSDRRTMTDLKINIQVKVIFRRAKTNFFVKGYFFQDLDPL